MLVPTVALIEQQEKVLKRYMSNEFRIGSIKGGASGRTYNIYIF